MIGHRVKQYLVIACLLGFAAGGLFRKASSQRDDMGGPGYVGNPPVVSQEPIGDIDQGAVLEWGISGDLVSEELLELPPGGHRMAETTLWSLQASPEKLREHWEAVMAAGEADGRELDHLMMLWVRRDPEGALEHTKGGEQEFRCLWGLAKLDSERALAEVDPKSLYNMTILLRGIGQTNPEFAMALREQYPNHTWHMVVQGIVDGLFDDDPEGALNYAISEGVGDNEKYRMWATRDPIRAFNWGLANEEFAGHLLDELLPVFLAEDENHVNGEIDRLPTGEFKLELIAARAKLLAGTDPDSALQLVEDQEGSLGKKAVRNAIGEAVVHKDPVLAREILGFLFEDEPHRTSSDLFRRNWVNTLIDEDPMGVLELAKEKGGSETPGRANYLETGALKEWAKRDHDGAVDWLADQAEGEHRDRLSSALVNFQLERNIQDYSSLLDLMDGMKDREGQRGLAGRILRNWKRSDAKGMEAYFESENPGSEYSELYQEMKKR